MLRRRLHRYSVALVALVSLLFAQLALSAYVCPGQVDVEAMAAMMQARQPCHGMDPDQPLLCHQHGQGPMQTLESAPHAAAAQPALVPVLLLPRVADGLAQPALPPSAQPEARPPPDPLFLATLRLRV